MVGFKKNTSSSKLEMEKNIPLTIHNILNLTKH